jgi:hypothetical protein
MRRPTTIRIRGSRFEAASILPLFFCFFLLYLTYCRVNDEDDHPDGGYMAWKEGGGG